MSSMSSLSANVDKGKEKLTELVDKASLLLNKSLSSMVKGIRAHKDKGQSEYIAKCLTAIKKELKSLYPDLKAEAIRKLIYLQMIGYDMGWASFHIVEVMSQPWFGHKRIGYLAAALSFTPETDVILLTTHLFRKAFQQSTSSDSSITAGLQYETGAAISCLANICTPDLAKDLLSDIYGMMNSSKPYIRKKAVLVLLKIFKQFPKALRLSFDRLKEKLGDENQGVVSAAVYVICELAAKKPKNYLSLAQQFFKILTSSSNNWVLIKVVKLLGSLVPLEPRLAKKLTEPLVEIITTTPAKSLLYECVNTLLCGKLSSKSVVQLCLEKLRTFIEDPDQNLKYLGLLGLHKLMQKQPRVVQEHQDLILDCLKDDDPTIRMRSLDLLTAMVSKRNLSGIVRRLVEHLEISEGSYREHVLGRILEICSQKNYAFVSNFEWYIKTLVDLTHISGASRENAEKIREQLMDAVIRVPDVRPFGVKAMADLLLEGRLLGESNTNAMSDVLYAAAWIIGEFSVHLRADPLQVITTLVGNQVTQLSKNTQNVFIQNAIKVFAATSASSLTFVQKLEKGGKPTADEEDDDDDEKDEKEEKRTKPRKLARSFPEWIQQVADMLEVLRKQLLVFTHSSHVEVQERAVSYHKFIKWFGEKSGFWAYTPDEEVKLKRKKDDDESDEENEDKEKETKEKELEKKSEPEPPKPEPSKQQNVLFLPGMDDMESTSSTPATSSAPTTTSSSSKLATLAKTDSSSLEKSDLAVGEDTPQRRALLISLIGQFFALFGESLNPVNKLAQKKVPVPNGLDLDQPINEPEPDSDDEIKEKDDGYLAETKDEEDAYVPEPKRPLTQEEKDEARKKREQLAAQRETDPYYIKDKPKTAINVEEIPLRTLDKNELPEVEVKKKNKKKNKKSKLLEDESVPEKTYKIMTDEEMPEGAAEEPEKKKEKDKKEDVSDQSDDDEDLSAPLRPDEVLEPPKKYAAPQIGVDNTKKPAETPEKGKKKKDKSDKSKKEKHGKKKHKKKDGEKGEKGEKHKKKKHKQKDEAPEVKSSPQKERTEKPSKTESQKPQTKDVLELFDPISPPATSPTPTSPALAPTPTEEKTEPLSPGGSPSRGRVLYQDSTLTVYFSTKANESGKHQPSCLVLVEFSMNPIKSKSLNSIKLRLSNTKQAKISALKNNKGKLSEKGATISVKDLKAGEGAREVVTIDFSSFSGQVKIPGRLSYKDSKDKGKSKKECEITIPNSTFILPKKISSAEFKDYAKTCNQIAERRLKLQKYSVTESLKMVQGLLHVHLVEAVSYVASYYGSLLTDRSHVAVVIKAKKGDESGIDVQIKTNNQNLSDALLDELNFALQN